MSTRRKPFLSLIGLAVLCALLLSVPPSALGSPGTQLWASRYSTASDDFANADAFSPDSAKVFATGTGSGGMLTWAYNASNGAQLWSRNYNYGTNEGKALGVSPDGSKVYVTGQSLVSGHYDYVTIAYDTATGNRVWFQRFDSTSHLDDIPAALAVSPDGSKVFVTGSSAGSSTGEDYATVAYDASTGTRLWVMRFNWANLDDAATAIGVSPDSSRVFVTGSSVGPARGSDYGTIAYDAASGAKLWLERFNGPLSDSSDSASALVVSPDETKVFVSGLSEYASGALQTTTVAYSASVGTLVWSKSVGGVGSAFASPPRIDISPDGTRVYVLWRGGTGWGVEALTAPAGTLAWQQGYDRPGQPDIPHALAVGPDGQIFSSGSSGGSGSVSQDIATWALAPSSTTEWTQLYNGPANGADTGNATAVSPDGTKVAVAGSSTGSGTGLDSIVIVYSTS